MEVHVRRRGVVGGSIVLRQRLGGEEHEVSLRRSSAEIVFSELAAGPPPARAARDRVARPAGARAGRAAARGAGVDPDSAAGTGAGDALLDARSARCRRGAVELPPADGLRDPRDPRLRAGRAPARRALAEHRPSRPPDGEGARRCTARRHRGRPRPGSRRRRRPAGRSSFDAAVRAAGALALAHVLWNRRVALVGTAPASEVVRVHSVGHDWEVALDALAEVMPEAGAHADRALRSPAAAVSRAREIVVVTSRPERVVDALLELRRNGRSVSLVVVASETYAGRPAQRARHRPPPCRCARAAGGGRLGRSDDRVRPRRAARGDDRCLAALPAG